MNLIIPSHAAVTTADPWKLGPPCVSDVICWISNTSSPASCAPLTWALSPIIIITFPGDIFIRWRGENMQKCNVGWWVETAFAMHWLVCSQVYDEGPCSYRKYNPGEESCPHEWVTQGSICTLPRPPMITVINKFKKYIGKLFRGCQLCTTSTLKID